MYLLVIADCNDCNYVHRLSRITNRKLKEFLPLIEKINNTKGHNWPTGDNIFCEERVELMYKEFGEELIEEFQDYVPYGEYGIHTIKEIYFINKMECILYT